MKRIKRTRDYTALLMVGVLLASISLIPVRSASADEGMWTFDNPPLKQLRDKYGFTPTKEWLDHVRLASVRFNDGGSGSFVSPNGLVLTNHHVARGQLQKISTPQKDYVKDGFYARTPAEEVKCPDLELNVLMSMEDVSARVASAVKQGMTDEQALEARKAVIATIEKESLDSTGLRSDVVPLYDGGEYWLYRYKKYTDVRLVFAPEQQAAFYGGDPDNFTYPRYDLDIALFRVYENDKPVHSDQYFKWNPKGPSAGDLVFVSGNPGSTDRLDTMAQISFLRDYAYPATLNTLQRRVKILTDYAATGTEQAREASNLIFGLNNSLKALSGEYQGLKDKDLIAKKQADENAFRELVNKNPQYKQQFSGAWDEIASAENKQVSMVKQLRYRSVSRSFSRLIDIAMTIVQYVAEVKKPDTQRLDGYHDSQLDSLKFGLLSPAPVYPELEKRLLADSFSESLEQLGPNDDFVRAVLGSQSSSQVADAAVSGTKLFDPEFRKQLIEGGQDAVTKSNDPMLMLAKKIDPFARQNRKWVDDNVTSVVASAEEKIGKARFAVYGKSVYPDATFTLRLSYGTVKGYPMNGTEAPPVTTFYGLYDRAISFGDKPPFDLTERYKTGQSKIALSTPLDFVSTCDIIGGNSGSPVINRDGDIVGVIFDGNIESLVGRFIYDDRSNRAVAVDCAAITEALTHLYDAGGLVNELEGRTASVGR